MKVIGAREFLVCECYSTKLDAQASTFNGLSNHVHERPTMSKVACCRLKTCLTGLKVKYHPRTSGMHVRKGNIHFLFERALGSYGRKIVHYLGRPFCEIGRPSFGV